MRIKNKINNQKKGFERKLIQSAINIFVFDGLYTFPFHFTFYGVKNDNRNSKTNRQT